MNCAEDMITFASVILFLTWTIVSSRKCTSTYNFTVGCADVAYGTIIDLMDDVTSVSQCALLCSKDNECMSAGYDSVTSQCTTNLDPIPPGKLPSQCADRVTFVSLNTISCRRAVYEPCDRSDDCMVVNSECRGGTCYCNPGYSFNPSNGTCVENCTTYGDTFTPDVGSVISGHNSRVIYMTDDVTCQIECASDVTCRSAEYSTTDTNCYLSEETALTAAKEYTRQESYTVFHRNCQ